MDVDVGKESELLSNRHAPDFLIAQYRSLARTTRQNRRLRQYVAGNSVASESHFNLMKPPREISRAESSFLIRRTYKT